MSDDPDLEQALGAALTPDPDRQPPADRVAALRAYAAAKADRPVDTDDGTAPVVPLAPRHGKPRREVLVGGIAASVGVMIGAAGVLATRGDDPKAVPTEPITFAAAAPEVRTTASLINHTWGVELLLDVEGLPAGAVYDVAYATAAGGTVPAGSFLSVADKLMKCRFNAAALRADVTHITVTGPDGEALRADLA